MPQWTAEQLLAIGRTGCDLLVSASAGTGKTAVLVERIVRLALDGDAPTDLDRFLVVTFTESAAAEMRERIGAALRERAAATPNDRRVRRQLLLLDKAQISTLHAFCSTLLRQHFHRLGLDPEFSILPEDDGRLLRAERAREVFAAAFRDAEPRFLRWLDSLSGANPEVEAAHRILTLHAFQRSLENPDGWTARVRAAYPLGADGRGAEQPFDAHDWFPEWRDALRLELAGLDADLERLRALALRESPGYLEKWVEPADEALDGAFSAARAGRWPEALEALRAVTFPKLPGFRTGTPNASESVKAAIEAFRDRFKKNIREDLTALSAAQAARAHGDSAAEVHLLLDLADRFERDYTTAKRRVRALDFNDLEQLALRVLRDAEGGGTVGGEATGGEAARGNKTDGEAARGVTTGGEAARACRERFEFVLVDEYQDINPVQEAILGLASRQGDAARPNNLFAVGDVKQSIYEFRLAAPEVFLRKYDEYPPAGEAPPTGPDAHERALLGTNFRSRAQVLTAVNTLFGRLMRRENGGLDYDEAAALRPGLAAPAGEPRDYVAEAHFFERSPKTGRAEGDGAEGGGASGGGTGRDRAEGSRTEGGGAGGGGAETENGNGAETGEDVADWESLEREAWWIGRRILEMTGRGPTGPAGALRVADRSFVVPALAGPGPGDAHPDSQSTKDGPAEAGTTNGAGTYPEGLRGEGGPAKAGTTNGRETVVTSDVSATSASSNLSASTSASVGGLRPARFRDVVVLVRSLRTAGDAFLSVFQSLGIPMFADRGAGLSASPSVRDMLNLLRLLDNPLQDIPLAAVLRSPLEGWRGEDLAQMRAAHPDGHFHEALRAAAEQSSGQCVDGRVNEAMRAPHGRLARPDSRPHDVPPSATDERPATERAVGPRAKEFLDRIDQWRTRARREPLADLLAALYEETDTLTRAAARPDADVELAHLRRLYDLGREFDTFARQGLARFLTFVDDLRRENEDLGGATPPAESDDVVRLLTIHKSKGLEFPIVFLPALGGRFNLSDVTTSGQLASRRGALGVMVTDLERMERYAAPGLGALRREKRVARLAEETRILYVALTRAREKLILTASVRKLPEQAAGWLADAAPGAARLDPAVLLGAAGFADWIGTALALDADSRGAFQALAGGASGAETPLSQPSAPLPAFRVALHGGDEIATWTAAEASEVEAPGAPVPSPASDEAVPGVAPIETTADIMECGSLLPLSGEPRESSQPDTKRQQSAALHNPAAPAEGAGASAEAETVTEEAPWHYPFEALARCPARIAAGEARRRLEGIEEPGEPVRRLLREETDYDLKRLFAGLAGGARDGGGVARVDEVDRVDLVDAVDSRVDGGDSTKVTSRALGVERSAKSTLSTASTQCPSTLPPPSSTQRGSLTHLILQHLDLLAPIDPAGLSAQVDGLIDRGFLTEEQREAADLGAIARFFESPLGRRLLAVPPDRVWREVPFLMGVTPQELGLVPADCPAQNERIRVQGVMDCVFEEEGARGGSGTRGCGGLVLLDYKTDAVPPQAVPLRRALYLPQMRLYGRALTAAFPGRPLREAYLCFLAPGMFARLSSEELGMA